MAAAAQARSTTYAAPLRPLLGQGAVTLDTLRAVVESKPVGSCSRRKAALAVTAVAQALELGTEAVQELRGLGKGYSPLKDAAPRDLPSDELIVEVIDGLPSGWQWVAGICATYGARPCFDALIRQGWSCAVQFSSRVARSAGTRKISRLPSLPGVSSPRAASFCRSVRAVWLLIPWLLWWESTV